jgi:hypothetical protein
MMKNILPAYKSTTRKWVLGDGFPLSFSSQLGAEHIPDWREHGKLVQDTYELKIKKY